MLLTPSLFSISPYDLSHRLLFSLLLLLALLHSVLHSLVHVRLLLLSLQGSTQSVQRRSRSPSHRHPNPAPFAVAHALRGRDFWD